MNLTEMAKQNPMLCRAQRENGELIYGSYCRSERNDLSFVGSIEMSYSVDPDTLQPWTGAYDKNGLPIFLGDILECPAIRHGNGPASKNQNHGRVGTVFLEVTRATGTIRHGMPYYSLQPLPEITKKQLDFLSLPVGRETKNQAVDWGGTYVHAGIVIANNTEPESKLLRLYDEWVERTEAWRISTLTY